MPHAFENDEIVVRAEPAERRGDLSNASTPLFARLQIRKLGKFEVEAGVRRPLAIGSKYLRPAESRTSTRQSAFSVSR